MRILALVLLSVGCASAPKPAPEPKPEPKPVAVQPAPEPVTAEAVTIQDVKRILAEAHSEVQSCYEAILTPESHPDVDLVLRLYLRADGSVIRVEVIKMEPDVGGLVACFSGVLARLRFPADVEPWELEFPIKLRAGGVAPALP